MGRGNTAKSAKAQCDIMTARLASFPGLNPNPVLEIGADGKLSYANDAAKKAIGEAGGISSFLKAIPGGLKSLSGKSSMAKSIQWEMPVGGKVLLCNARVIQGTTRIHSVDITEMKRAEGALKESEERYKLLVDTSPDFIISTDLGGRITSASNAVWKLFGYTEREVIGKRLSDFVRTEDIPKTLVAVAKAIRGKRTPNFAMGIRKKGGGVLDVEASGTLLIKEGKPIGLLAVLRDVTANKKADDTLKESEARFKGIFDSSNDAIFIADAETHKFIDCNRKAEELIGRPKAQILSMRADELHPKDRVRETMEGFGKQAQGKITIVETEVLAKSGKRIPVEISGATFLEGGKLRMAGMFRDITDHKKAEETLSESMRGYRDLAQNLPAIVYHLDLRTGEMSFFNSMVKTLTGFKPSELRRGKICRIDLLILPEDRAAVVRIVKGAIARAKPFEVEYRLRRKDGEVRHVWEKGTPVPSARGTVESIDGIIFDVTERVNAEETAKKASAEVADLYDNAPCAYHSLDERGKFIRINNTALKWLGYKREELVGKKGMFDVLAPGEPEKFGKFFPILKRTGKLTNFEATVVRKGGTAFPILLNITSVRDESGKFLADRAIWFDMSEQHKTSDAVKESEERFRGLVETSSDWIWEVDASGRYTYVSPRVYGILGYKPEEVIGKTPFDLMPPDEAKRVAHVFVSLIAGRKPIPRLENTTRHKSGRLVVLETTGVPFFGPDGKLLGYRGVDRDVTERKKAADAAKESEARFKEIFESSNDAVFVADVATKKLVDCNRKAVELTGRPKAQILSMGADELHPKDRVKETMEGFERQVRKEISVIESELLAKNGTRIPVEINAASFVAGGRNYVVGIFRDITERKKVETLQKEYSVKLEKAVAERTAELETKLKELEDFKEFAVGRELDMIALKKELDALKRKAGGSG